jgi:DNA-binding GntR family transcriptional regulator
MGLERRWGRAAKSRGGAASMRLCQTLSIIMNTIRTDLSTPVLRRAFTGPVAPALAALIASDLSAPLLRRALYQDVAERLREQIYARQLEPGHWIDEMKLCAEFGISRTPLREALKVLAAEGLVTMKLRRGAYVTEMSRADVTQVYHLLALLESDAAAQVAAHANDEGRATLAGLHARLESQVRRREAFFATNEQFHMALLQLSGNRWALQTVTDLRKVMKLNRHHSLLKRGRLLQSLAEHRALMKAIEQRDAVAAGRLMREHFASGLEAAA